MKRTATRSDCPCGRPFGHLIACDFSEGGTARRPRFTRPGRGILRTVINGVTYVATWYRSGGPGTRAYWAIQHDGPHAPDYSQGNDWYEPSERRVREAVVAYAARELATRHDGGAR